MADVFLSYNREDQPIAKRVADGLVEEGIPVWLDIALRAGENYDEVTEERLRKAKAVVVLWSTRSVKSRWVRAEATLGARKNALVPVMIEPCDRPIMFELIQTADLSTWSGDRQDPNWRAFIEDVQGHITRADNEPEAAQADAPPSVQAAPAQPVAAAAPPAKAPPPKPAPPAPPPPKAKAPPPPPKPAREPESEQRARPKKKGGGGLFFVFVLMLLIAVGGGGYYYWTNMMTEEQRQALLPASKTAEVEAPIVAEETAATAEAAPAADFQDCELCPKMLRVSGGTFQMGAAPGEYGAQPWEGPAHEARVGAFAISETEVTFAQWDYCVADGGCLSYSPTDRSWGRGQRPVIFVNWADAQAYVQWLSRKTSRAYRLPSEAEWEFAARGGATTAYWWGARFEQASAARGASTLEVTNLPANSLGLVGVGGNVGEWVQDCYTNAFSTLPTDGRPNDAASCAYRVVRDGAFSDRPDELRVTHRVRFAPSTRASTIGFRVASGA